VFRLPPISPGAGLTPLAPAAKQFIDSQFDQAFPQLAPTRQSIDYGAPPIFSPYGDHPLNPLNPNSAWWQNAPWKNRDNPGALVPRPKYKPTELPITGIPPGEILFTATVISQINFTSVVNGVRTASTPSPFTYSVPLITGKPLYWYLEEEKVTPSGAPSSFYTTQRVGIAYQQSNGVIVKRIVANQVPFASIGPTYSGNTAVSYDARIVVNGQPYSVDQSPKTADPITGDPLQVPSAKSPTAPPNPATQTKPKPEKPAPAPEFNPFNLPFLPGIPIPAIPKSAPAPGNPTQVVNNTTNITNNRTVNNFNNQRNLINNTNIENPPKPVPRPEDQPTPDDDPEKRRNVSPLLVKQWDSITKQINTISVPIPPGFGPILALIANESAEAQEDSHKERKSILERLQIVRLMQLMNTIASLHNAAMLSRNLGQTLGEATSTVITAIGRATGFMSSEQSIDVNQLIGEAFNDFMKSAIGEEAWNGTKASFNRANRILSSASQIMSTLRGINDSRREILEWIGENTGKIGNALKRFGVVGESAYSWMPERFNIQTRFEQRITRVREGVDTLDDAASSLSSVASETVNIMDEYQQLVEQRQQFEQLITSAETKVRSDNTPIKSADDLAKSLSQAIQPTAAEMEPTEDATP
jgi:cell division protein ZapA (FtsZ GTPase activity inhibitor)